jgi:Na+-driven multidrug efflux pump
MPPHKMPVKGLKETERGHQPGPDLHCSRGVEWLRILSYSYFVYGWWMVAVQAFNGAGDTVTPTKINLVFFWLIQIPLAWLLALHFDLQATGVFWAVFVSETSVGVFTLWLFSRGKWKTASV